MKRLLLTLVVIALYASHQDFWNWRRAYPMAFGFVGSSGHAFSNGVVTFGLMATSSALVIPLTIFLCGTRIWALGKKHGFMTPVQMFRDRWECGHIGTVIFAVQAILLVPYIVIAVMGGGATLRAVSNRAVPFWLGGAVVSSVI